ncbi:hypothetical protein GOP47_0015731 [Adiantum capillus-veneris]|uniref:Uncharacterized protein n=1 Tax=Adiantum capillus-veneris TaxID=13818 RepID=A0A9D4ZDH3_ADICA|nr:hypothetical protein GOP47_0015731 [Adiantum capillus-veneris]
MASCTRASVGRSIFPTCRSCAAESIRSCSNQRNTVFDPSSREIFANPTIRTDKSVCCALDGNSTSSTTADADPPSSPTGKEQEEGNVAEYEEAESVGKALSQIRQERLVSGQESPSKTEDFWRGVLEEIQLIEWPSLQKVLGTTGVVTGIIIA